MFPYSYRNTHGSLGELEIEVGTRARTENVSTQFRVLPNFHECFFYILEILVPTQNPLPISRFFILD